MNLFFQITQNVSNVSLVLSTIIHLLYVNVWIYLGVSHLLSTQVFFFFNLCNNSNCTCIQYALYDLTYFTSGAHLTNLRIHGMQFVHIKLGEYSDNGFFFV
jgi:hypothetical protein